MASHGAHQVVAMLKVKTPRDNPSVKSLTGLYWNANWYEREIWEMLGINFEGHPELYPLLLSDDASRTLALEEGFQGLSRFDHRGEGREQITTPEGYTEYYFPPTPPRLRRGRWSKRGQNTRASESERRWRSNPTRR